MADRLARVLIVEDEGPLAEAIGYNLSREGFAVDMAADGRSALDRFRDLSPDAVILDLMLPEMSGLDVCRAIRSESTVPIIVLTAKDTEADKIAGLELGADDYVTKPFSMPELISRVRANLRRARMPAAAALDDDVLRGGPVALDVSRHEASVRGTKIPLTPKEFEVLEALLRRKGRLVTRDLLIDEVWGSDYFGDTKTLDVHVKRLRQKIEEDPHNPAHLVTIRGLGYKFVNGPHG
jgi:two-component system, OmpR family, response regulator RegX3